ncbi:MAG: hypothetical protein M4579_002278 [Chaenotheca gracillima]|nr:MAG: hypothetical protein M4579_002278 [Chaenotheca gracillima]
MSVVPARNARPHQDLLGGKSNDDELGENQHNNIETRPFTQRRATDPSADSSSTLQLPSRTAPMPGPYRQRNSSPYSRGHLRARSTASALTPPSMARAHSLPLVDAIGRVVLPVAARRPSSPLSATGRHVSPSRRSMEEAYPSFGGSTLPDIGENTTEMVEPADPANIKPPPITTSTITNNNSSSSSPVLPLAHSNSVARRHRTSSPLRHIIQTPMSEEGASLPGASTATASSSSSPLLSATKYNESYPTSYTFLASFSSTSSLPSTPTSARSRSPSISSLETIPDTPAAEEAALEAERIAELKAAAEKAESESSSDGRRRSSLDIPGNGATKGGTPSMAWAHGSRDKRKRWSVCGAERRSDLDLETIWED